jgi:glyoxylase-like metal-dependent hydrolase (beta-lactamase superfamily II)
VQIHTIDLDFQSLPRAVAAYLVEGPGGHVLVETGPGSTQAALVRGLAVHGLQAAQLSAALVTHIHLDHAGAAGWLTQEGVTVCVHPMGAPHLVEPERLLKSAGRIYGEDMDRLWGAMIPASAERVRAVVDGERVEAGGLVFQAIETPGHAGHHHAWLIEGEETAFTGDVAGVRMPGEEMVAVPAPPPEIDLEAWHASLDRLSSLGLQKIYPTHFGGFEDVEAHLNRLRAELDACAGFIREAMVAGMARDALVPAYLRWQAERAEGRGVEGAAVQAYQAANPLEMSVDGLMRYWRKAGV